MSKRKVRRCLWSGSMQGAYEAQIVVRCTCGFSSYAAPRHNRRIAGEILEGWSIRLPSHAPHVGKVRGLRT